jgi:predicted transcriptional regulator
MLAKDLVSDSIMAIKTSDSATRALTWMEDNRVGHLPIVNEREFLGLVSETDINNLTDLKQPIGNIRLSLPIASVNESQHILDVVKICCDLELSVIPVVDTNNNYLGCITRNDLLQKLAMDMSILDPGGIIVLEVDHSSYDPSQIAQIVSSNDAKILALYVSTRRDSTRLEVTIKINRVDISAILQTFNRYQYTIKATFAEKDNSDDLRERYESLMNYLNI